MSKERRLGRGLESLLGNATEEIAPGDSASSVQEVDVSLLQPNPFQPRKVFDEREMSELVESVRSVGILQPIVVRKSGGAYQIIAGERRWRAAQIVGMKAVPITVRAVSDDDLLTLALIENLQREDLNPLEKARGFKQLMDRFNLTQEAAAARLGVSRSAFANFIRLLDLPESVQHVVSRGTITMGHARALLAVPTPAAQQALALRIEEEGLSVREVEKIAAQRATAARKKTKTAPDKPDYLRDMEDRLRQRLGTKVSVEHQDGRGRLTIHFFSDDDFHRVLDLLGVSG